MDAVKKLLIAAVVILLLLPVIVPLLPKAFTIARFEAALAEAGLPAAFAGSPLPAFDASQQLTATIGEVKVDIYHYESEAKISINMEYQKKDPGQAMVQAWGLATALGAAQREEVPTRAARNGKYMLVVTGYDQALLDRIVEVFRSV